MSDNFWRLCYSTRMTLFEKLKASTKSQHDELEKNLDLLSPDLTLEGYTELLKRFYGVYAIVESVIERSTLRDAYYERRKLPHLIQDLNYFGLSSDEIDALPKWNLDMSTESLSQLIGTLYVLEGSTLGGLVLAKHFHLRFDLDFLKGLSFFSGYGEHTMLRWKTWREFSENFTHKERLSEDEIITHARATFVQLGQWLLR